MHFDLAQGSRQAEKHTTTLQCCYVKMLCVSPPYETLEQGRNT